MDTLTRLLIAAVVYYLGDIVINQFIRSQQINWLLHVLLILLIIGYAIFGAFPIHTV